MLRIMTKNNKFGQTVFMVLFKEGLLFEGVVGG